MRPVCLIASILLAVSLPAAGAAAGQIDTGPTGAAITFTGDIEPATMASICQEETHFLVCNGALMKSSSLNLGAFEQGLWTFHAVLRGVECPILDVFAVEKPKATLTQCGSPVPGCPMRVRIGPQGVPQAYFLMGSASSAFTPLSPFGVVGTLQVGDPWFVLASGVGTDNAFDFQVPDLTGAKFWLQAATWQLAPDAGPWRLTNATCLTVLGPSPPCQSIDC